MQNSEFPFVVAVVGRGVHKKEIRCSQLLTPQQLNLLFVLAEHVNRAVETDTICHRMKVTTNAVRIQACRIRKKLSHDWAIECIVNKGFRLLYIGGPLSKSSSTSVEMRTK